MSIVMNNCGLRLHVLLLDVRVATVNRVNDNKVMVVHAAIKLGSHVW